MALRVEPVIPKHLKMLLSLVNTVITPYIIDIKHGNDKGIYLAGKKLKGHVIPYQPIIRYSTNKSHHIINPPIGKSHHGLW